MPSKLNAQARLKLIERVILKKEPVAKICRENNISRVIFYRWLKRYLEADKNSKALEPKAKTEATVVNRVTPEQETKILEVVISNPDLSCKGIYQELLKDSSGKPSVGYHGVQNVLERLRLSTKEERIKYGQNISKTDDGVPEYNYLTPEQKLAMLNRVLNNKEQVSDVCKEYGLSRTAFYNLKNRYLKATEDNKEKVLERKKTHVDRYWRQTPEEYERAVLDLVGKHPEYGIRNLLTNLPQIGGVPIVSHHGIQNILRRNNLSLYEQRLAYTSTQVTPFTRFVQQFEIGFGKLFVIPAETRAAVVRFIATFSISTLSSIIILGGLGYITTISGGISVFLRPGMFFASLSLLMGTIFLAYSMKYYFSLALVLSFSSGTGGDSGGERENGGIGEWLKKIFGVSGKAGLPAGALSTGAKAGGLEANLDHIKLGRYPFISIHLPFYNEKKVANRIISACTSMDYPNFEVIVCDDSTDETKDIVNEWKNHPRIKILHRPTREGFKGGALSYALKAMDPRTEFVCVFDADFVPYPDSLMQFVKYFKASGGWSEDKFFKADSVMTMPYDTFTNISWTKEQEEILARQEEEMRRKGSTAVVAGYQWHVLNKSENWITRGVRTEYSGSYVIERPAQEIMGAFKIIHGSVYCMRADVMKHFGWGTSITEDYEMTLRIYEKGFKVCYTPYIQAPSECVSTIKRLIRQRMRWAEGHSFNTRKMLKRLFFNPRLGTAEKVEFAYLAPYYLQAFFFIVGTIAWLLSEVVFRTRLPFWTALWGWSLVLTNFFAMPLLNGVGLFLEEAEEKDYLGTFSFIALSYLLVPFQAYAAVKGFIEEREGPWFRTPKTGTITDVFTRGRFYRWLTGILNWKPAMQTMVNGKWSMDNDVTGLINHQPSIINPYLALVSANNRFNNFQVKRRRIPWLAKTALALLLIFSTTLLYLAQDVKLVYADTWSNSLKLQPTNNPNDANAFPAWARVMDNSTSYGSSTTFIQVSNITANRQTTNYWWLSNLWPNGDSNAFIPPGNYYLQFAKQGNGAVAATSNYLNLQMQLLLTSNNGATTALIARNNVMINQGNPSNVVMQRWLGNIIGNNILNTAKNRLAVRFLIQSGSSGCRSNAQCFFNIAINNTNIPARLVIPSPGITVPEVAKPIMMLILAVIIPVIPALVSGRFRKPGQSIFEEFVLSWKELIGKLVGRGEEALDELPV
jgi:cellulose synthase/poly-beta-1,6-N-acetylglucosamine synthase-like glycosyltransferase/transposase-like protein